MAESPYVPALRKGLALLELLAEYGPLTLAQVERVSGLNRTMSYRLLRVMGELGYVEHDPVRHHYELGFRLMGLGAAAANRLHLAEIAWPYLSAIPREPHETVSLAILAGNRVVYLGVLRGAPGGEFASGFGGSGVAHATAAGKAMLAFLPEARLSPAVARTDTAVPRAPRTIADGAALQQELTRTRDRGYAIEDEEDQAGVGAVGVPILDARGYPIAALSLAAPIGQIDLAHADRIAARLWQSSREMSRRFEQAPEALAS